MAHDRISASAVTPTTYGCLSPSRERMITEYILDHLTENLTVFKLSQICCLSRSHFSRAFKRSTGLSPQDWIREKRLQHAKNLIKHTKKTLTEISFECGFCDQAHFCHTFYKSEGVNALAWRYRLSWKDSLNVVGEPLSSA